MSRFWKVLLAVALVAPALGLLAPAASAEIVTKTWTQSSQTDFLQGSGAGTDVYAQPGSVTLGADVSADKSRWITNRGRDFWSYASAPYVMSGQGSLYGGTQYSNCYNCYYYDTISTGTPDRSQVTVYLLPSGGSQSGYYNGHMRLYLRFTDGTYTQDHLLRGIESNGWSSWRDVYGSYSEYKNINGWNWFKFTFDVPSHMDAAKLRVALNTESFLGNTWSCHCYFNMYNYVAFGMPSVATFTSNVHNAGGLAKFDTVSFSGAVPAGSSLTVETRTSGDGVSFTPWAKALSGEPVPSPAGNFIQYRAVFDAAGGSPRLDEVNVRYSITTDTTPPRTAASVSGRLGCANWFVTTPTLTLQAQDDLSGVAATFLSLDGGLFERYVGPRAVGDGEHLAEFYSVDHAGNVESPRSLAFKADSRPPVTGLDIGSPSHRADRVYVSPTSVFTLDPQDATSGVKATTVNTGAGAVPYAGPFALGGNDGARAVTFWSEDRACNVEPATTQRVFVDGTAPRVAITSPAPSSVSVLGRGSEDVEQSGTVREKLADFGVHGSDADVLVDIAHAGALEMCGPAAAEQCAAVGLSGLAPRLGGAVVVGEVTIEADAADPVVNGGASGLAFVAFYLDGKLQAVDREAPFAWTWDTTASAMGNHEVAVLAADNLGNAAVARTGVSVVPIGLRGVLATGAFVLEKASAPAFAKALYEFVRAKAEAVSPPEPPQPPPGLIPELPPHTPPVDPPVTLPDPPVDLPDVNELVPKVPGPGVPPPPPLPERVCVENECVTRP